MSHLDPKRPATATELKEFGLLVGAAFALIAGFTFWRGRPLPAYGSLGGLGAALILLALSAPRALAKAHSAWMTFAVLLSKVTTPVLMGAIYFLVLTPLGLAKRVFGRNPLSPAAMGSLWVKRSGDNRRSNLERQF